MGDRPPGTPAAAARPRILDFGEWTVYKAQNIPRKEKNMPPSDKARSLGAVLALIVSAFAAMPALAQDRAGEFDHYLLALSWMPAFCTVEGDRRMDARCASGTRLGWVVHGLWPQHAGGAWPEYCTTAQRNPSRRETAAETEIFGTPGAAWHQWNKHGRCTGLSSRDYFALTRAAFGALTLPEVFAAIDAPLIVAPEVIEAAFIEANTDFSPEMMITTCRDSSIVELRLCLNRDLAPRPCDEALFLRECALDAARLHPLR